MLTAVPELAKHMAVGTALGIPAIMVGGRVQGGCLLLIHLVVMLCRPLCLHRPARLQANAGCCC